MASIQQCSLAPLLVGAADLYATAYLVLCDSMAVNDDCEWRGL